MCVCVRHGVNSILELELLILKKMEFLKLELKFGFKKSTNLPFDFLIQKNFFRDNPTWNINYWE